MLIGKTWHLKIPVISEKFKSKNKEVAASLLTRISITRRVYEQNQGNSPIPLELRLYEKAA
jgi:hypothetical protein